MSSRIIVKNLPKHLTTDKFKQHFASKGDVTDAKIIHTPDGRSRLFGFIGYRSEQEAQEAVTFFDKSFIGTARISVGIAKSQGDVSIDRPWSKYSTGSSFHEKTHKKNASDKQTDASQPMKPTKPKTANPLEEIANDPKLRQFLEVMQPRSKIKTWQNDDVTATNEIATSTTKEEEQVLDTDTMKQLVGSDDELYEDLPNLKQDIASDSEMASDDVKADQQLQSNDDWLKSKKVVPDTQNVHPSRLSTIDESAFVKPLSEEKSKPIVSEDEQKEDQQNTEVIEMNNANQTTEKILDTGRLFVRNLSFKVEEGDLKNHFETFGPVTEVHIPQDRSSKKPLGYAYVLFLIPENALQAYTELDGSIFQGRLMHILPAEERPNQSPQLDENEEASFKAKQKLKMKTKSTDETNWNSLFMSADAVAEAMATKLSADKSELLDRDADNLGVRMALAETQIIQETIGFLQDEGISIDAFKNNLKKERSDTTILVKNIPFSTQEQELSDLFSRHGDVVRLVLPPTRTIAIVEYATPNEAKAGLRSLAYKNFKGKPLFLEKAPIGVFTEPLKKKEEVEVVENNKDETDNEDATMVSTLFVKNLSFDTTDESFEALFKTLEGFRSAKISKKKNPKKPGELLSMGFGFVEFRDQECAKRVLKSHNNVILDGHALQLKFSDRGKVMATSDVGKSRKSKSNSTSSKLIVRNVPFQANKQDIVSLFSAFGQIKRVRLPKKLDKSHRGFAFVDFVTAQEAKAAFENLHSTHLYGRRLVLEWAEDDESLETIREKTKRQFETLTTGGDGLKKRSRVELGDGNKMEDDLF